jgi:hypothetical protein
MPLVSGRVPASTISASRTFFWLSLYQFGTSKVPAVMAAVGKFSIELVSINRRLAFLLPQFMRPLVPLG